MVDVDVLDEGFHLRALLDLLLGHRLGHLCRIYRVAPYIFEMAFSPGAGELCARDGVADEGAVKNPTHRAHTKKSSSERGLPRGRPIGDKITAGVGSGAQQLTRPPAAGSMNFTVVGVRVLYTCRASFGAFAYEPGSLLPSGSWYVVRMMVSRGCLPAPTNTQQRLTRTFGPHAHAFTATTAHSFSAGGDTQECPHPRPHSPISKYVTYTFEGAG